MENQIAQLKNDLSHHPMYQKLDSIENVRAFMEVHIFAVWDFMSLLKRLQRDLTCVSHPWAPAKHPGKVVRFINEIVLGEESDVDENGVYMSHFQMYLEAMKEVGCDVDFFMNFYQKPDTAQDLAQEIRDFIFFNLNLAETGDLHQVAAVFLHGRENLIPEMFEGILKFLPREQYPKLSYYLERHIEVDGGEHGPMAQMLLDYVCPTEDLKQDGLSFAKKALELRKVFWNYAISRMESTRENA